MTFITAARVQRVNLKNIGDEVKGLMGHPGLSGSSAVPPSPASGEAKANIMLAYRHLEDSAMRLGKAIQAMDGGVSCYDDKAKIAEETQPAPFFPGGPLSEPLSEGTADAIPLAQRPACG